MFVVERNQKKLQRDKTLECWKGERRIGLFASVRRINLQLRVYFIKKGRPTSREVESVKKQSPKWCFQSDESSGRRINNRDASKKRNPRVFAILPAYPVVFFLSLFRRPSTLLGPPTRCAVETCPSAHVFLPAALQMVLGDRALLTSITSSRWLHMATNRSKKSLLPPRSISACIVPLLLNVLRHRMIRAR
jgi:hypothetical protein